MGNVLQLWQTFWGRDTCMKPQEIDFYQRASKAARNSNVQMLKELNRETECKGGSELSSLKDPSTGLTLLHHAMERGNKECVQFLIGIGCDLTKGDCSRETPLHSACMTDNVEALMAALEVVEEVNLNITDMWRRTLIMKAMVYNSRRVLRLLLSRDVCLNIRDIDGLSLVHVAVTYNWMDLLRELAAGGADLNHITVKGRSPLTAAILAFNLPMVKELLVLGVNTNSPKSNLPVVTAISQLIRCFENGRMCSRSEEILHMLLAAHGCPLYSDEPNVFQRVLMLAGVKEQHLPLLYKIHACSNCLYDDLRSRSPQQSPMSTAPQTCTAVTLFDLARRATRMALMTNGHNVMWAVERLDASVPPAVKGLLLLKDCDHKKFAFPDSQTRN